VSRSGGDGRERNLVRSFGRGLAVIRALGLAGDGQTLTEVALAAQLKPAAARRLLITLRELGYVRGEGRRFSLTPKVLELGYWYRAGLRLADVVQPHLERLRHETEEYCSISVLEGDETVCTARAAPARIMKVAMPVGTRLPAYPTCVGRILLADLDADALDAYLARVALRPLTSVTVTDPDALRRELEHARRRGWAVVDGELEEGLRSVAAPVRDARGRVVAAANVGAYAERVSARALRRTVLPRLVAAAAGMERDLAAALPRLPPAP
jgi:IclR family transcriptional regulator, pca regulon regulatory protein